MNGYWWVNWIAFQAGTLGSWFWQWQKWKTPERRWRDFWPDLGLKHVMANFMVDQIIFGFWSVGIADPPLDWIGHHVLPTDKLYLIHGAEAMKPQTALALGFGADMFGDQVVYYLRTKARSVRARFSKPSAPSTPSAQEATP